MASVQNSNFNINTKYKMNSGYEIPALGYGVSIHLSSKQLHSSPFSIFVIRVFSYFFLTRYHVPEAVASPHD
jgi:hypothetical protein